MNNEVPLKDALRSMMNEPSYADMAFIVGDPQRPKGMQRFAVLRALLAARSTVFKAMLYGPMVESKEPEVEIPDVTPEAFANLLEYVYLDEVKGLSMSNVHDTAYVADKYLFSGLRKACYNYIQKHTHKRQILIEDALRRFHGLGIGDDSLRETFVCSNSWGLEQLKACCETPLCIPRGEQELWKISQRRNGTHRPNRLVQEYPPDCSLAPVFLRQKDENLPPMTEPVLILFKYYDFERDQLNYVGSRIFDASETISNVVDFFRTLVNMQFADFDICEEKCPKDDRFDMLDVTDDAMVKGFNLGSGDILCFGKRKPHYVPGEHYSRVDQHLRNLYRLGTTTRSSGEWCP